jgi:hypothetical protein
MHKSRLAGFIIDCKTDNVASAAEFWAAALGAPVRHAANSTESSYVELGMPPDEPYIEVQKVSHASRVHLDIESNDVPAEVARLEALGAKKIDGIKGWVVMEAPTGQRFCVVPVVSAEFESRAHVWGT